MENACIMNLQLEAQGRVMIPPSPPFGERAAVRWINSERFLQFTKFCLVGGSGVFVDMGILYLLADPNRISDST